MTANAYRTFTEPPPDDTLMSFARYIALGDSMSIDRYPALDASEAAGSVGRGVAQLFVELPLGAASLLFRNEPVYWPEFMSRDLLSRSPKTVFENRASDGGTVGDVFGDQLSALAAEDGRSLLTLTVGGNDLLSAYAGKPADGVMSRAVRDIIEGYRLLVDRIRELCPDSLLILTTIYDPTDGTGKLPGVLPGVGKLPLQYLDALNDAIRAMASPPDSVLVADVHRHFLGHGVTAKARDRWYWKHSLIEPGAQGASEIRRMWLEALEKAESE